jgi:hypothetical protein
VPGPAAPPSDPLSAEQRTAAADEQTAAKIGQLDLEMGKTREALQASKEAEAYNHFQDKIADFKTESTKRMSAAEKHLGDERQRYADMRITDFWENKSTASHVLAALSVGLGQFASALTGTPNAAMHILDTAVENHRKQQETLLKKQEKQVEMSESDRHFAQIEIQNQEAGMYQAFAAEREKMLRAAGYTDKMIAADQTQAALVAKAAEKSTAIADKAQQSIKDHEEMKLKQFTAQTQAQLAKAHAAEAYAGAASHRASIKKTEAETRKIDAEARGEIPGSGAGRAATTQIAKATLAEHANAAMDNIEKLHREGVHLTDDEKRQIQDNRASLARAEHMGLGELTAGRLIPTGGGKHLVARTPYDGLSEKKKELARNYDILAQKGAALVSPSHDAREIEHARGLFDLTMPGIDEEQTMGYARGQVGAAKALGGAYTGQAQRGAESERAAREGAAPAGPRRGTINGRPALIYPDGTFEPAR